MLAYKVIIDGVDKFYGGHGFAQRASQDGVVERVEVPALVYTTLPDGELIEMTVEEIAARDLEASNYEADQYKRDRGTAYASMNDQLDMIYWDAVNGTTTFVTHRAEVKALYPKPI